jgi:hypothetical protein
MEINLTKGMKPKMTGRKLISGANWQGMLKQKGVQQTGVKQGLGVSANS